MTTHPIRRNQPVHDELHPHVYRAIVGLSIWFVLSVWLLFDRGAHAYVGVTFAVVTAFFLIAVALPAILALTWWRNSPADEHGPATERFREWAACEFATWTGRVSGTEAAMQILLPIAAVCIGIMIFGLVFALAVPKVG
jgi:hypothetical protein